MRRDERKCQVPGCMKPATVVHHKQYPFTYGTEPDGWLISLCQGHHKWLHDEGMGGPVTKRDRSNVGGTPAQYSMQRSEQITRDIRAFALKNNIDVFYGGKLNLASLDGIDELIRIFNEAHNKSYERSDIRSHELSHDYGQLHRTLVETKKAEGKTFDEIVKVLNVIPRNTLRKYWEGRH